MLLIFITLILVEGASAEIIINNLAEVYNAGDSINASITIQKQESAAGYLESYLNCGEKLLVHKQHYALVENKKKEIGIEFPASLDGRCHLEVIFDGESKDSQEFEISNIIDLDYSLNNRLFFPAEKINGFRYHENWLENLLISASSRKACVN